jgi:hypothetical protein
MCWTMTKWFLRSIDASSRQALRMHAPEYQEIHCQSREIHVAGTKSALIRVALNWRTCEASIEPEEPQRSNNVPIDRVAANPIQERTAAQSTLPPTKHQRNAFSRIKSYSTFRFQ